MPVADVTAIAALALQGACLVALGMLIREVRALRVEVGRSLGGLADLNPYAMMLGKVVMFRKYEASDWERGVVVAASWHGALQIRDAFEHTFWLSKGKVPTNVIEVG